MTIAEIIKKGSGVPLTGDLIEGGIGIDTTNGKMYSKKADGTIFEVGALDLGAYDADGLVALVADNAAQIAQLWAIPAIAADKSIATEVKRVYSEYLGREPSDEALTYWIGEVNLTRVLFNDLEQAIYVAAQANNEVLLKKYISAEEKAIVAADKATIETAPLALVSAIKAWYATILHEYSPDDAGIAYWIREVNASRVLVADLDEAIFNAAFNIKPCYAIPDTLVADYELNTIGIAVVKTDATDNDLVIPTTIMGEVSIDANDNVVVEADVDNIQSYIDEITANPTRAYNIVTYYNRYFGRNPLLDGVHYWMTDGTADAALERAIFVAGSMNGETPTGNAYAGEDYAALKAELQTALDALSEAQAGGDQATITAAESTYSTKEAAVVAYEDAGTAAAVAEPTRAEAITEMYNTYLGREPDAAGLNYWINDTLSLQEIEVILMQGEH